MFVILQKDLATEYVSVESVWSGYAESEAVDYMNALIDSTEDYGYKMEYVNSED